MRLLKAVELWRSLLAVGKYMLQSKQRNEATGLYVVSHPNVLISGIRDVVSISVCLAAAAAHICASDNTSVHKDTSEFPSEWYRTKEVPLFLTKLLA